MFRFVAPSCFAAESAVADWSLSASCPMAWVPPEPLAWLGGNVVRTAFLRREQAWERGEQPDLVTRALCAVPKALGIHVAR